MPEVKVSGAGNVLSNFFMCFLCKIPFGETWLPTLEHLYVIEKASFHNSNGQYDRLIDDVVMTRTAARAKAIGKGVRTGKAWDEVKEDVMRDLLRVKFDSCAHFRHALSASPGYIEHTVPDPFWGVGSRDDGSYPGRNVFGRLLSELRNIMFPPTRPQALVLGHSFIRHLGEQVSKGKFHMSSEYDMFFHGIGGATVRTLLTFVKHSMLLDHYNPSVTLLQIGGNDLSEENFSVSRFQRNLHDLINHCHAFGCVVVVMGIWNRPNPRHCVLAEYNKRRKLVHNFFGKLYKAGHIYFYNHRLVTNKRKLIKRDGVHPTPQGYSQLLRCLQKAYAKSLE